jgi:hypothetical protein
MLHSVKSWMERVWHELYSVDMECGPVVVFCELFNELYSSLLESVATQQYNVSALPDDGFNSRNM